jgi:hypothetical protein
LSSTAAANVGADHGSAEENVGSGSAEASVVATVGVRKDISDYHPDDIAKPNADPIESSSSPLDVVVPASVAQPDSILEDSDDQEMERLLLDRSHSLDVPSATGSRSDLTASDQDDTVLVGGRGATSDVAGSVHSEVQDSVATCSSSFVDQAEQLDSSVEGSSAMKSDASRLISDYLAMVGSKAGIHYRLAQERMRRRVASHGKAVKRGGASLSSLSEMDLDEQYFASKDDIYDDLDLWHCAQESRELSGGRRPKRRSVMWTEDEDEMRRAGKRRAQ